MTTRTSADREVFDRMVVLSGDLSDKSSPPSPILQIRSSVADGGSGGGAGDRAGGGAAAGGLILPAVAVAFLYRTPRYRPRQLSPKFDKNRSMLLRG